MKIEKMQILKIIFVFIDHFIIYPQIIFFYYMWIKQKIIHKSIIFPYQFFFLDEYLSFGMRPQTDHNTETQNILKIEMLCWIMMRSIHHNWRVWLESLRIVTLSMRLRLSTASSISSHWRLWCRRAIWVSAVLMLDADWWNCPAPGEKTITMCAWYWSQDWLEHCMCVYDGVRVCLCVCVWRSDWDFL